MNPGSLQFVGPTGKRLVNAGVPTPPSAFLQMPPPVTYLSVDIGFPSMPDLGPAALTTQDIPMKLYFAPGACSLSPHIVLREAGVNFDLEQVDLREKKTTTGGDYWEINSKGQVPVLELDEGGRLTEGPVIVQYISDKNPGAGLMPPAGSMDRYKTLEWLNHTTSELHKTLGAMFRPTMPDEYKKVSKEGLVNRFKNIDKHLAGKQYLMGDKFNAADAYLFTVLRWTARLDIDLSPYPNIKAYMDRVQARPKVQEAMKAEGLLK
jgi:glutathione S-transferase